jgi:hypothetical protein
MFSSEINAQSLYNLVVPNSSLIREDNLLQQQFKLCLQQYFLGLDISPLLNQYFWLSQAMNQLKEIAPQLFKYPQSIHQGFPLTFIHQQHRLESQFDLLLIEEDTIHLFDCIIGDFDWQFIQLKQELDCFLMIKTSSYLPTQLTYSTCVIGHDNPNIITCHYSSNSHQLFKQKLSQWLLNDSVIPQSNWRNGDSLTAKFLRQEMSAQEYIDAIPEVVI